MHARIKKTEAVRICKSLEKKYPVAKRPGITKTKVVHVKDQKVIKKKLNDNDFELIEILTEPRKAESIRHSLFLSNFSSITKATMRGAEAVRTFYNGPALRKRKLLEKGGEK